MKLTVLPNLALESSLKTIRRRLCRKQRGTQHNVFSTFILPPFCLVNTGENNSGLHSNVTNDLPSFSPSPGQSPVGRCRTTRWTSMAQYKNGDIVWVQASKRY